MAATELWVCELGQIGYREALELQEWVRDARQQELIPDTLLLLEHNPAVYTRGRRSAAGELSMGEAWYAARRIEIIETNRGGKVTYHGPGQLVGYPIVAVQDVVAYVRLLEQALVTALREVGIDARARDDEGPDYTGVWVENRKIASIGVHVARGVTTHGFAINIETRALEPFTWVVACGLPEVQMTAVESELRAVEASLEGFGMLVSDALATALGHLPHRIQRRALEERIARPVGVGNL
ncbi:MAG TPA: lipoyl(octanoyl) transferase LipB [Solirubrobacteraceae bacterium]|nr:lipoyl(octanoyl) transferase LipB [Solirubrobacteraceae bacterium]